MNFEENGEEALKLKIVIQILDFKENLDEELIKNALEKIIKESTLYT